jgi:hypothetical protein
MRWGAPTEERPKLTQERKKEGSVTVVIQSVLQSFSVQAPFYPHSHILTFPGPTFSQPAITPVRSIRSLPF